MITLLLDSSSKQMAIGLAKDHKLIATIDERAFQTQSELMTLRINELLNANNIKAQDISEIVVTNGPGSFTGVRIAVTIAKVMAYALNVPLYAVSSLHVFTHETKPTICVLDARNNRSFVGVYKENATLVADTIMTNDEIVLLSKTEGYVINGETDHLKITSGAFNRFQNMLNQISEEARVQDVRALKPRYMKG